MPFCSKLQSQKGIMTCLNSNPLLLWMVIMRMPLVRLFCMDILCKFSSQYLINPPISAELFNTKSVTKSLNVQMYEFSFDNCSNEKISYICAISSAIDNSLSWLKCLVKASGRKEFNLMFCSSMLKGDVVTNSVLSGRIFLRT